MVSHLSRRMRSEWVRCARAAAVGILVAAASGCAAEKAAAPAPEPAGVQKSEEAQPATIEEAQAQLERARAQLGGRGPLGGAPGGAPGPTSTTQAAPPSAAVSQESERTREAPCVTPCRAIASMRRAVDAICRMAGEQDARCADARKTLGESAGKVAACGC
jgi:hypothetical protein